MYGLVGLVPYGTSGSESALAIGASAIAPPIAAAANHGATYLITVFMISPVCWVGLLRHVLGRSHLWDAFSLTAAVKHSLIDR
jgi:hypothetical protein